jgi:hypothetical protein
VVQLHHEDRAMRLRRCAGCRLAGLVEGTLAPVFEQAHPLHALSIRLRTTVSTTEAMMLKRQPEVRTRIGILAASLAPVAGFWPWAGQPAMNGFSASA